MQAYRKLTAFQRLRDEVVQAHRDWTVAMRERLRRSGNDNLVPILEALGAELEQAVDRRKAFLERPVTTPAGIELDTELTEAVSNLTEAKSPLV